MANNQREMERRERREQKDKRQKRIIWFIIAVIIVVLAIMKVCEININSVKNHFTDADGNFTLTEGVVEDNFPYNLDSSLGVSLVNINNKLGIITPSSFTVLNSQDATAVYGFEHGYSNPVLEGDGIYSLVYDQGAKKYRLDTVSAAVYEKEAVNSILCADVAKNGNVALATTSKEKLCDITVYNKTLKELMTLSENDGYIISAALNENGKKLAFAVVSGENANLKTTVYVYDVSSGTPSYEPVQLPHGLLIDLSFCGNSIYAVGDSYVGVIKRSGKYADVYESGSISTRCFCFSPSGELIIAYNSFSNSSDNVVAYVKSNTKVKLEIKVDSNVKSITSSSSLISVLTNSEIISYNISNGEEKERISVDNSVKAVCRMGSEVFINKQSVVDRSVTNND